MRVAGDAWPPGTVGNILPNDPLVTRVDRRPKIIAIEAYDWQGRQVPAGVARPTIALPIATGKQIPAILLCGVHENGTSIDPDEIRAIGRLCDDAALVYNLTSKPILEPNDLTSAAAVAR